MVELIPSTTRLSSGDFLQQPPFELYESDVVWSFLSSPDSISPSPPFMHDRFSTPQSGLSAILGNDHRRLVSSQSKIIPASPRSENVQVKFHQSAPVNIPVWPKKFHDNFNEINDNDGDLKRLDEVEGKMVPPHVIVARSHVTFSVFEGVGRTLKGRDLRRVRNGVFRKTGYSNVYPPRHREDNVFPNGEFRVHDSIPIAENSITPSTGVKSGSSPDESVETKIESVISIAHAMSIITCFALLGTWK